MADRTVRPSYADVMEHLDRLAGEPVGAVEEIGRSVKGRAIRAATFTDPEADDEDKQHVLIVASQHGSEESGRAMVMATMDFLVEGSDEAKEILRKQIVAFVPCANPDGAVANTGANAEGVDIAHTWSFDAQAGTPEGRALEDFAARLIPDVSVDVHGRAGGGMKELAWVQPGWGFSSDRYFVTAMSLAMAEAGEAAGFPQCELSPAGLLVPAQGQNAMLGSVMAYRYKTLALGLETIEHYYRQEDWRTT
ncbi:MAG: M14 family zinc carboxypeptidase, partial [Planctomycetota bacterium]